MKPIPKDAEALIEELESCYPPRCIAVGERPEDAHRYAGQVELVEALRARLNYTRDNTTLAKDLLNHVRPQG